MKLNFDKKTMDIGTFPFNYLRTLNPASTCGAEINECLIAAEKIKDNNLESWTVEWAIIAEKTQRKAEEALRSGQITTARQAFLRASNYYRSAMFPLSSIDKRLDEYLILSRENFQKAAKLFSPQIEVISIPMGEAKLPAYFLSAGKSGPQPTLIAVNGGDTTNEELVHMIGFGAAERGWSCIVFEGPGQWSALQLNPELYLRHDYEVPVKAVVDYLLQREDVAADKIALIGYSLSTQLVARASAFDKRICACICDGGIIVDVYEAWHAVWPVLLQKAPDKIFNFVFETLEKLSPQLRGIVNRFGAMFGLNQPTDIINAWKPFNITGLAPQIDCPMLILMGEAEYAQTDVRVALSMLRFISELTCPVSIHEFTYEDGWAASHCQIGAIKEAQAVIFNWLDKTINNSHGQYSQTVDFNWDTVNKYMISKELVDIQKKIRAKVV